MLDVEYKQVRCSIFCPKNSPDTPWKKVVQNAVQLFFSPSLGKSLMIVEFFSGLPFFGTSFARKTARGRYKKKLAMPRSYTGDVDQYDTKYSPFDYILQAAFVGEKFWEINVNQPVTVA